MKKLILSLLIALVGTIGASAAKVLKAYCATMNGPDNMSYMDKISNGGQSVFVSTDNKIVFAISRVSDLPNDQIVDEIKEQAETGKDATLQSKTVKRGDETIIVVGGEKDKQICYLGLYTKNEQEILVIERGSITIDEFMGYMKTLKPISDEE
jgi:hypothetical protein